MLILAQLKQALHTTQNFARAKLNREFAPPVSATLALGARGEQLALAFLTARRYKIVACNVKLPVGRSRRNQIIYNEVDIIAYDEDETLCFIEVKTRRSDWYAAPEANVDLRKQRQITRAARVYRRFLNVKESAFRYDVVTVILPYEQAAPQMQLLKNFWTESKFNKRRWATHDA